MNNECTIPTYVENDDGGTKTGEARKGRTKKTRNSQAKGIITTAGAVPRIDGMCE